MDASVNLESTRTDEPAHTVEDELHEKSTLTTDPASSSGTPVLGLNTDAITAESQYIMSNTLNAVFKHDWCRIVSLPQNTKYDVQDLASSRLGKIAGDGRYIFLYEDSTRINCIDVLTNPNATKWTYRYCTQTEPLFYGESEIGIMDFAAGDCKDGNMTFVVFLSSAYEGALAILNSNLLSPSHSTYDLRLPSRAPGSSQNIC
ncbi:hypothetical protein DFH11DRAFT_1155816 [Phellopilus nigrolimitatus]|nr:hypothetical protein DFH11DRAFT_1155816 [Phellopilus nigrolimitatus]